MIIRGANGGEIILRGANGGGVIILRGANGGELEDIMSGPAFEY